MQMLAACSLALALTTADGSTGAGAQDDDRLDPCEALETLLAADAAFRSLRYAEAMELYSKRAGQQPPHAGAVLRWGQCLAALDQPRAAAERMQEALARGAGDPARTSYEIARQWARAGELERCLDWLETSLAERHEERGQLATDETFAALRDDPRFRRLAGLLPERELGREEGWGIDLDHYLEEVRRMHADPARPAHSAEFHAAVEALRTRIADLDDTRMATELQRITVLLGDGHSVLYPIPTPRVPFLEVPVCLYFFEEGLFVLPGGDATEAQVGRRVVAIGGVPTDDLLTRLRPLVSRDNEQGVRWLGPRYLRNLGMLRALGMAGDEDAVSFRLRAADGEESEWTLAAAPPRRLPAKLSAPPELSFDATPLYLQRVNDSYWYEELPDEDALYVQMNQVRDGGDQTIEQFAEELTEVLRETGARGLVLDLRHNSGGNNFLIWPMIRTLVAFEKDDAENQLFVIMGRNTFSACQNFLNFIERSTHATFVGEASSSRPIFTGESTEVALPYSGLRLSISTRYWQDSYPGDRRAWIEADLPVPVLARDYFEGRDPALESVFEWRRRRGR